ncbi:energy transducer TonB [Bradyrhizobium sp. WD16]|nr:energy transducer TonB [Bradyrhizobium sp. WD16]UTD30238.1 energy transducer TonB [Bradyrhizobium sp. WD16]
MSAAAVALFLHVGGAVLAFAHLSEAEVDEELGAPGMEISLELAAPQAPPSDLPPGPDSEASPASNAASAQKAELMPSELPKEVPVESEEPDRVVAPNATDKPPKDEPVKPAAQAAPAAESAASEATARPTSETAKPSDRATTPAQGIGAAKQRVRTTWQKELVAHLDRHKRYPSERTEKAAEILVSFTLDRRGHILASSIARSSGDPAFDAAALAMLKRSDPVPAPPPLIADETLSFTVPVIFRVNKGRG